MATQAQVDEAARRTAYNAARDYPERPWLEATVIAAQRLRKGAPTPRKEWYKAFLQAVFRNVHGEPVGNHLFLHFVSEACDSLQPEEPDFGEFNDNSHKYEAEDGIEP